MLDDTQFDHRDLRDAFGCFPSGITVVALHDEAGKPTGVTVSSFSSLSMSPPLCMFSLVRTHMSCRWIEAKESFVVNVLSGDQQETALQFAQPREDKFEGIKWRKGSGGMPVIDGALCHFECKKWATYDGGDHVIVVGRITHFEWDDGDPLLFCRGKIRDVAG